MFTFKGTYRYSIDQKGRLSVPAKFRSKVDSPEGEPYVVTKGFEGCLYVYPKDSWEPVQAKLYELKSISDSKARRFLRILLGNANDVQCDKLGRITIPGNLIEMAAIKKEVIIIGVLDKFEIWDPEVFANYEKSEPDSFEDVAKDLLI